MKIYKSSAAKAAYVSCLPQLLLSRVMTKADVAVVVMCSGNAHELYIRMRSRSVLREVYLQLYEHIQDNAMFVNYILGCFLRVSHLWIRKNNTITYIWSKIIFLNESLMLAITI